jgi:hypothetical protein
VGFSDILANCPSAQRLKKIVEVLTRPSQRNLELAFRKANRRDTFSIAAAQTAVWPDDNIAAADFDPGRRVVPKPY